MQKELLRIATYAGLLSTMVVLLSAPGSRAIQETKVALERAVEPAAAFFVPSITIGQIRDSYGTRMPGANGLAGGASTASSKRVRVLVVPGHQPDAGGAEFGTLRERDLVVDIADRLAALLRANGHYEVVVARSKTAWNALLETYFDTHADAIEAFRESQASLMAQHVAAGRMRLSADQVYHHDTPTRAALELYGINKWASENNIDITLHLHLNDFAGRRAGTAGEYDGFTVYVPERQYSNALASKAIGVAIASRLNAYHATSTFPREDVGVVEDQELIAIGSYNTADDAALLLEYGYIYEPQFRESSVRGAAIDEYARATYAGLQDFFGDPVGAEAETLSLPADIRTMKLTRGTASASVYQLQKVLHALGAYPSAGRTFSECPVSGVAGACTDDALKEYQTTHNLAHTGRLDESTVAALRHDLETR